MKNCRDTGDLRAYLDHELAPDEMARLEGHLAVCPECAGQCQEMARRAARVADALSELGTVRAAVRQVRYGRRRAAAVALAASIALFFFHPQPQAPAPPKTANLNRPFVALDNEPIDTGLVVRVALGPEQVQADVIIAPDGRPRAYRLVEEPSSKEGRKTE